MVRIQEETSEGLEGFSRERTSSCWSACKVASYLPEDFSNFATRNKASASTSMIAQHGEMNCASKPTPW
jgi:hypothetical protein